MTYETIRLSIEPPIATVRLDRPERMNAVVESMYRDIRQALDRIEGDPDVRCVVLTGSTLRRAEGEKQAFCAGADLKEHGSGRRDAAARRLYVELAHATVRRVFTSRVPIVAAVNGPARGAGAELAIACDFVIFADEATLAFPEVGLGTFVGGGATWILPRLVGLSRARELIYTGRVIDGREAVDLGLAIRSVPLPRLSSEAASFAQRIAAQSPVSIAHAKRLLGPAIEGYDAALERETEAILSCMETSDWADGIRSFVQGRRRSDRGG